MALDVIFIDTETGGLDWNYSLLQVGLVAVRKDQIILEREINLHQDVYHVQPEAMAVNQIDLGTLHKVGVRPKKAVEEINFFIHECFGSEQKPILGGHNLLLDRVMLMKLYQDVGMNLDDYVNFRNIDTMSLLWMARELGLMPKVTESPNLKSGLEFFGLENEHAHNALADARSTALLFLSLKHLFAEKMGVTAPSV